MTLPEQDFKRAIREYLDQEIPDDARETVERLELELASPGDWELAKHDTTPESENSN